MQTRPQPGRDRARLPASHLQAAPRRTSRTAPATSASARRTAATPGSAQDFTVNVGDRIFFDTDSSSIRADAQQTLDRQAQWLNQYPNYAITVEGHADERGTREYNLALGARRAACHQRLSRFARRPGQRMKTISYGKEQSGRRLRRHFLLVAEPPCGHRARRRRHVIAEQQSAFWSKAAPWAAFLFDHTLAKLRCFLKQLEKSPVRAIRCKESLGQER